MSFEEDHPLALSLTFSTSLGLLPVSLSLTTTGCGIKKSEFPIEESGDEETSSKCHLSIHHLFRYGLFLELNIRACAMYSLLSCLNY